MCTYTGMKVYINMFIYIVRTRRTIPKGPISDKDDVKDIDVYTYHINVFTYMHNSFICVHK